MVFEETAGCDEEDHQHVVKVPYNEKVEKLLPNDEDVKVVTEQQELEATWHMPLMEQSKWTHALEREPQMSYMANGLCHQHHQMKRWCNTYFEDCHQWKRNNETHACEK